MFSLTFILCHLNKNKKKTVTEKTIDNSSYNKHTLFLSIAAMVTATWVNYLQLDQ